jgi:hypothetical protein
MLILFALARIYINNFTIFFLKIKLSYIKIFNKN